MSLSRYMVRASIPVSDLERADLYEDQLGVIDELHARGVAFERYDDPVLRADEKGIHELDDGRVAWFKDPDGNTFALEE